MNAPTPANVLEAPDLRIVKRTICKPSRTNPRTRRGLDEASLKELAQSMAPPVGIIEPLVGRELPDGTIEIVCGERRWRSSGIAGIDDIPILIRKLTDFDVLRIQMIENVNREDLDALEEAEGYEKLMKEIDPSTGKTYTADKLAEISGVSRSTIFHRRKLLALCDDGRKAYYDGKIDASTALLIARIPVEKLQLQALKDVTAEADWSNQLMAKGDKMSYRRAREILQDKYMLDLDRASFDTQDADLLPKAGNCTACPKRTGNAPDLFDDVKDENVCTDTVCFGIKKAAHVLKLQKEAENTGAEFIGTKKAKKLIGNQYSDAATQLRDHGYAPLDTLVPGDAKKRTLGQLLEENNLMKPTLVSGKPVVQKTIVANPHRDGQMIETVNIEAATKALREAGFEITLKGKDTSAQSQQDRAKQEAKDKAKLAKENTWRARLFDTLHEQIEAKMPAPDAAPLFQQINAMLAEWMFDIASLRGGRGTVPIIRKYAELPEKAEDDYWWPYIQKFQKQIKDLTPQQHALLMIDLLSSDEMEVNSIYHLTDKPETMLQLAEVVGIDAAKIKREVAAEAKAAAKPAKPEAKKPAAKAKPTPAEKKSAAKAKPSAAKPAETKAAAPAAEAKAAAKPAKPEAKKPAAKAKPTPAEKKSAAKAKPITAKPAETKAAAPAAESAKPAATWPFPEPGKSRPAATWPFPTPVKGIHDVAAEPSSTPTPAAQAQDSGAKTKAAPAKPASAKAEAKRKAAAAA